MTEPDYRDMLYRVCSTFEPDGWNEIHPRLPADVAAWWGDNHKAEWERTKRRRALQSRADSLRSSLAEIEAELAQA